jgi:N-acetylglucosaminyldiphosphoundecaprenol N-acetyl-beta-D-mannosaminyltransferase
MTVDTINIGEIPISLSPPHAIVSRILQLTGRDCFRFVNVFSLTVAQTDPWHASSLKSDGINSPDGRPIAWLATRLARVHVEQVRGPSCFEMALDKGRPKEVRHFLLGGSEHTLQELTRSIERRFPGAVIAGTHSPPFRELTRLELRQQDEAILRTAPDIVWVGLGTPKQDREAFRLQQSIGVNTAAVGAAFDFLAGTKREAPSWVRRLGFEWLFRFGTEPRRLWRRYLIGNSRFVILAARELRYANRCRP